jgi:bacterioferritin (cytochrome b1)
VRSGPDGARILMIGGVPGIQNEASLRLLAGDMLPDEVIVASLTAMRAELDHLEQTVGVWRARRDTVPHRAKYLELNYQLASDLRAAHRRWIDATQQALDPQ